MVRILLVQPPHRDTFGYSMPPLGALHLGATARRRGHQPTFLDLALLLRRGELPEGDELIEACARRLLAADPEVLGLGAMISSLPATLHLAAEVRRLAPALPIVLGGQGPETVELPLLARHPAIDLVAVGEADETLSDVLDVLADERARTQLATAAGRATAPTSGVQASGVQATTRNATVARGNGAGPGRGGVDIPADLFGIPGLALRRNGVPELTAARPVVADLDTLDLPAFDLAESPASYAAAANSNANSNSNGNGNANGDGGGDGSGGTSEALFPIDLGRGCSYSCSFCTTSVFWGRRVRYLSPGRAADAFDRLAELPGMADGGCVYVTHDLFTAERQRVLDICAEKRRRGNTLPWECRTRIDLVDEELLESMAAAGCRRILYGVESDSEAVLASVRKGGRQAVPGFDVRAVLRGAARAGMASIVGVMAGIPGEREEDVEAGVQLLADAAVIDGCSLSMHWFNVTPGNGQAEALGRELSLIPGLHADLVRGHDIPAGQVHSVQARLIAEDPELFAGFRVFAPDWTTPRRLYLLTRNAQLLLEVLPRSLKACAQARGATLLQTLMQLLEAVADGDHCDPRHNARADGTQADGVPDALDGPRAARFLAAERAEHGDPWDELLVLRRDAAVRLASALIAELSAEAGDERSATLLAYERALFETSATSLRRFELDPLPLVRAMDGGQWAALPSAVPKASRAVLFSRQGEVVRAHALSDFLADAHELPDDPELLSRWPGAGAQDVNEARRLLAALTAPIRSN